jgi:hypothetical protein
LRWGRGAEGGEQCRLLGPRRGQIRQFDVAEAVDLLGQSGELDGALGQQRRRQMELESEIALELPMQFFKNAPSE